MSMSMRMSWSHEAAWPPDPASVSMARGFVCGWLGHYQLPGMVQEARVVVSELATNAVLHAGTPFIVTLARVDGMVMLSVRDESSELPASRRLRPSASRGRGLYMVDAYSSTWGVTPDDAGGKSVWATFAMEPSPSLQS